jgi:hypothetical protein
MEIDGRPDPLLLVVVLVAAGAVGIIAAVASTPRQGLTSFLLLCLLFLPLIGVLVFGALRVRTRCVLDKDQGSVQIDERSYARVLRTRYPIDTVAQVFTRPLRAAPLSGHGVSHGLFLELADADYLLAAGTDERRTVEDAWRIAQFLGVPLEMQGGEAGARSRGHGPLIAAALLYLLPVVAALSALLLVFDQLPAVEPSVVGLLGAVLISQFAAILASSYYHGRRPYEG